MGHHTQLHFVVFETDHTVTQAVLGFPTVQAVLELLILLLPFPSAGMPEGTATPSSSVSYLVRLCLVSLYLSASFHMAKLKLCTLVRYHRQDAVAFKSNM